MPRPLLSMSNLEKHELAAALGHERLAVVETASRRRWKASCQCGWNTGPTDPTNATLAEAVGRARWHLESVLREHLAQETNGVSVTKAQKINL